MYITNRHRIYYTPAGEQRCSRGDFLIFANRKGDSNLGPGSIRCFVRKVALIQCGQFMMGIARIQGKSITVSGAYGHDGLPIELPEEIWKKGVPLPDKLYHAWNTGGGWNGPGSEANAVIAWARQNLMGGGSK